MVNLKPCLKLLNSIIMKKKYIFKKTISSSMMLCCILLLTSYTIIGQSLNFTIDTAVDNGTSITETLTVGSDTYVLLIDIAGSGAETLFDLGGGDVVFYFGSGVTINTFIITLTKNGNPTNFKLDGIDYDTVEDGFMSILNQDDAEISSNQEYVVGTGAVPITNVANAADITAFKIIQPDVSDNTDFAYHNINVDVIGTLNTNEFSSLDNSVSVFPNPSNGNITIKSSGIVLKKVFITDINGRTIANFELNGITKHKELDLSSTLSSGIYLMTLKSENVSTVKKLIIE